MSIKTNKRIYREKYGREQEREVGKACNMQSSSCCALQYTQDMSTPHSALSTLNEVSAY